MLPSNQNKKKYQSVSISPKHTGLKGFRCSQKLPQMRLLCIRDHSHSHQQCKGGTCGISCVLRRAEIGERTVSCCCRRL